MPLALETSIRPPENDGPPMAMRYVSDGYSEGGRSMLPPSSSVALSIPCKCLSSLP